MDYKTVFYKMMYCSEVSYRIALNKRQGRSFNFLHFLGGRLFEEAFITKCREIYNSIYQRQ